MTKNESGFCDFLKILVFNSNKDIKNGQGIIPKYRAIYLDSVKNDKYHIIKTNNLFDDLINKFNSLRV